MARRPPSYYSLQGYSLPSIRGGGSRVSGAGEGLLLYIYAILHSFWCVFWNPSNYSLKALVLGRENMGFRAWTQGFQGLKPMLLQMRSINFENCKQTLLPCLQIKTFFTFIKLKTAALGFCIFMQFLVAGERGTEDTVLLEDTLVLLWGRICLYKNTRNNILLNC